jgi:predicted nucleic acid-binding protein
VRLPFAESVVAVRPLHVDCRDPEDRKFLECAVAGKAEYIISGDLDLRALGSCRAIPILSPADFLAKLTPR